VGRASKARRVATKAAYGGSGVAAGVVGLSALAYGVLVTEAKVARRTVGTPFEQAPASDGVYDAHGPVPDAPHAPDFAGEPLQLAVLGDSSAAGLGVDRGEETPGALLATGLAAAAGRPVRLVNVAFTGGRSSDLAGQLERLLAEQPRPDVAMVMVGANDVTHRVRAASAVHDLVQAVTALRALGCGVVVGTCPDLGTIEPVPQPLRLLARKWSRDLAAAQTVGVVEAGGRTVSLGDLLGAEFAANRTELFSADRFHPSAAGYAKAAGALLPSICAEVGLWPDGGAERAPDFRRGEAVERVSRAAVRAVREPGVEVSAGPAGGPGAVGTGRDTARSRRRGPWAVLLRRRQEPLPEPRPEPVESAEPPGTAAAAAGETQPTAASGDSSRAAT
jgi:lysophospholipase L1-like esterase